MRLCPMFKTSIRSVPESSSWESRCRIRMRVSSPSALSSRAVPLSPIMVCGYQDISSAARRRPPARPRGRSVLAPGRRFGPNAGAPEAG